MLFFAFSRAELCKIFISYAHNCHIQLKTNELTIQLMLCKNVTVLLPKILPSFFQMQEKLKTCWDSNLANFRRSPFGDDINVTFIPE